MNDGNKIKQVTDERGSEYGDFTSQAVVAQNIKNAMKNSPNWDDLDPFMKESLEMIAHKISRILNGNPNNEDSWIDIEGYANIARIRLNK